MNKSLAAVAALAMFAGSADAKVSFGECPKMEYIDNFEASRYSGKWYEIVRDRQNPYTISTDCVTKEFAPFNAEEESMDLFFRGYYFLKMDYMGVNGTLYQCDQGSPETWTCQATMGGGTHRSPIMVWNTDYDNFDISYSCKSIFGGKMKFETFSVAAREPVISEENLEKVKAIVKENIPQYDLDTASGLYWTRQKNWCQYDWKFDNQTMPAVEDKTFLN